MKFIFSCLAFLLFAAPLHAEKLEWGSKEMEEDQKLGGRWMMNNHFNEFVTNQHYTGKFRLIFFGYTFCPDVCPTSLSNLAEALDELEKMKMEEEFVPLFVSVDPQRDTPTVLREYVANFHPSIIGLTGPKNLVDHMAKLFKVKYSLAPAEENTDEHYIIDHSAGLYFMSPTGIFIRKFAHGLPGKEVAQRIKEIIEANK